MEKEDKDLARYLELSARITELEQKIAILELKSYFNNKS